MSVPLRGSLGGHPLGPGRGRPHPWGRGGDLGSGRGRGRGWPGRRRALRAPIGYGPPPLSTPGLPHLPQTSVHRSSSCRSRAFTVSASSLPLLQPGMATPTQAPTKGERRLGKGCRGRGGSEVSELRREDLRRCQCWQGRGEGKGMSVPPMGGGPCSAPLGAPWAPWAPSPSGVPSVPDPWWESGSRERKDARAGSYGNRVADPALHSMVVDCEEMGFEGGG